MRVKIPLCRLLFGASLLFSLFARAEVDLKSGTFSITRTDQSLDSEFSGMAITRTYNSTVGYDGLFGRGWCSGLETRLTAVAEGQLAVTECGAGGMKFFNAPDFKNSQVNQAIDLILKKMQSAGQAVRPELRSEIAKNPVLREKLIAQYEIKFGTKAVYRLNPFPNGEQVTFKNGRYTLKTAAGLTQVFNEHGQLVLQRQERGDAVKLSYTGRQLKAVGSQRGQSVTFKLDEAGHVTEMRGPAEITRFKYSADGYLTQVSQKSGPEKYTYADGLLVAVESDRGKTAVQYNPVTRFISKIEERGCAVTYLYRIQKQEMKFGVEVKSDCKAGKVSKINYEFQYAQGADGALFQKKMVATDGKGGLTSAEYAAEGKPSKIVRNGETFLFTYDRQNRLAGRETSAERVEYAYGTTGKIKTVKVYVKGAADRRPGSQAVAAVDMQQFNYDKAQRLSSVTLKDETIKYGYDAKGRLNSIESKAGPNFNIVNDGLTGRILQIKAAKYGAFVMQYAANGELTKNEWRGDIKKALAVLDRYELLRAPYEQSLEFGVAP